jgi:putative nucleotidyltransferase with HDIG domain
MSPASPDAAAPLDTQPVPERLREELDTMIWVQHEVAAGRPLPVTEADAAAHSLYVALQAEDPTRLPQLPLHDMESYTAVHAVNVALLAMALAESLELDDRAVRELGVAALLHDIGMARLPLEILAKAEQLTAEEREQVKQHPATGARIIIESDAALEHAAVVAYEHHIRLDGSGYPALRYPRTPHFASRLVQVCGIYHALRSPRPFRTPWPIDIVLSYLNERAGFEVDPELTQALTRLLHRRTA